MTQNLYHWIPSSESSDGVYDRWVGHIMEGPGYFTYSVLSRDPLDYT